MKILIKNGRVIDPSQNLDAVRDLLVEDGKTAQIGENLSSENADIFD